MALWRATFSDEQVACREGQNQQQDVVWRTAPAATFLAPPPDIKLKEKKSGFLPKLLSDDDKHETPTGLAHTIFNFTRKLVFFGPV